MTSLLAGTLDHGVRGCREVSESQEVRISSEHSGTPRYSPELALTTI